MHLLATSSNSRHMVAVWASRANVPWKRVLHRLTFKSWASQFCDRFVSPSNLRNCYLAKSMRLCIPLTIIVNHKGDQTQLSLTPKCSVHFTTRSLPSILQQIPWFARWSSAQGTMQNTQPSNKHFISINLMHMNFPVWDSTLAELKSHKPVHELIAEAACRCLFLVCCWMSVLSSHTQSVTDDSVPQQQITSSWCRQKQDRMWSCSANDHVAILESQNNMVGERINQKVFGCLRNCICSGSIWSLWFSLIAVVGMVHRLKIQHWINEDLRRNKTSWDWHLVTATNC